MNISQPVFFCICRPGWKSRSRPRTGRPAHDFFICTFLFACCALFLFLIPFSMDALIHIALLPFHPYLMTTWQLTAEQRYPLDPWLTFRSLPVLRQLRQNGRAPPPLARRPFCRLLAAGWCSRCRHPGGPRSHIQRDKSARVDKFGRIQKKKVRALC